MKKNKRVLILEIFVIILVVIGVTLAITYLMNSIGINMTNASLSANYTGTATLPSTNLSPIEDTNATYNTSSTNILKVDFSVKGVATNPETKPIIYDVILTNLNIPCTLKNENFKWKLFKNSTLLSSGSFSPTFDKMKNNEMYLTNIQQDLPTSSSTADSYQLLIWISEACSDITTCTEEDDQSDVMGKTISGSVEIRLYTDSKKALTRSTGSALSCNAADTIIQLAGNCTSWESGFSGICATSPYDDNGTTKYHEYRYIGTDINNFVKFNDDMYQIIGVFDDNSHGVEGEWLVKLIATNPLGGYSWGATNTATAYTTYSAYNNNWETANANILLNEYFLNATDSSSTYKSCSDWTYYSSDNSYKTKDCSKIIGYGIQTETLRNYIQPVTWYLKGYNYNAYSKQNFYTCERSDSTTISNCTSGNSGAYATKVTNRSIGLMYVSDYMYASGYYSSTDTTKGSAKYYGQQNWLYNGYEWTITPQGSADKVVFNVSSGHLLNNFCNSPNVLRPTFYLKSTIKIKSGDGTFASPFIIG